MNELSKYLVEQILLEDENPIKKIVVVYVGRFQPMHQGHFAVYEHLVKKFGKNSVFVGTSNKTDSEKSPFNFKEKEKIATTMYNMPKTKFVQIKNPYNPSEILNKFDKETTAFVTVVSEKDKSRLKPDTGKYFQTYNGNPTEGYGTRGYVYVVPILGKGVSGTESRKGLSTGTEEEKKKFFKNRVFGKFNKSIYDLVTSKLQEGIRIPKEIIEEWLIQEGTQNSSGQSDDGPNSFYPNYKTFEKINIERAAKIGYEVLDMVMSKDLEDYYEHPIYPNGPVKAASFFPAGVIGKTTAANQIDIYNSSAYSDWYKHVTKKAALIGYELIDKLGDDEEREESTDNAIDIKKVEKEFETSLNENINIPVKVGDTILTGRFKNKKTVVKSIGKDEHGMPTINGRKVVNFRLVKEGFIAELAGTAVKCEKCNHSWEIESEDTEKYLCHSCGWDSQQQEYDYDAFDSWREKMGLNEMSKSTLNKIEKFAEKKLSPEDIEFTKHFFDRVNDPRNGKEISDAELTGFFKRLSRYKKQFKDFLEKYNQIVVKDKRSDINIPFVKQANQIIAKTVMRKDDFKTSNPILSFESLNEGMYDPKNIKAYYEALCKAERVKPLPLKFQRVGKGGAATVYNSKTMKPLYISFDINRLTDPEFAIIHELTHQIKLETEGDAYVGKRDQLAKFKKLENRLIDKYVYSEFSELLYEQLDERGKLRPSEKLRRKAAMAGKSKEIARKRARTMKRRKSLDKLKKIAYKMAYRQVYDEFVKELFPDTPKSQLSIQQSKVVHKNVVRKKKRVLKRAKFKFLPDLRAKEVEKFTKKENNIEEVGVGTGQSGVRMGYPSKDDLKKIEKRVNNQRSNTDSNKEYQYDVVKEGIENSLQSKYKVDIDIYEYPSHLELRRIVVPQDKRGQGIGSKVMGDLVKYAQSNNKDLFTTPSSDFGGSKSRLVQFYKSFGFKDNKGSNRDFRSKESMVRLSEGKELEKLGIKDFKSLFKMMPSDLQKRVYNLKNFGQRLDKHPEGNVLKHTITVVNRSLKDDDIDIAIAAMFHDIGKDETAGIHPKKGHITHFGHEKVSASLVSKYKNWIKSVGGNAANVLYIVKNHMRYKQLSDMRPHKQDKLKSFRAYDKLSKFSKHDRGGLGEGTYDSLEKLKKLSKDSDTFIKRALGSKELRHFRDDGAFHTFLKNYYLNEGVNMIKLKEILNEVLLKEGGAYGHMNHPFDTEINLTFGDLKDIVNRALEGNLEFTREKTDGQALAVSWVGGRLVAARNKGHLKNKGAAALDIKGVADKFSGRGELEKAYNFAMKDLSDSIKSLSEKQREKIFKDGSCFMNLEVIYPTSVNVIPYGQPLLVFHGTMEYDESGVAIGENAEAGRILAGMIKQINKDVQDNYTIQGPPVISLPKSQKLSSKKGKYTSQISKLQKEFKLKDTDGVAEYHQEWWTQWVNKNSPSTLDNKTLMGLVKRWAFYDKSFRLDKKNITDEKTLEWAKKIDSQDQKKIAKDNMMKFENIFLGVGADVLEFTSSVLTVNPDEAVRAIKKRIDKTIKDVQKSGDPKKIEKLKLELKRLQAIGGPDKIVPNEGIVFTYRGDTFKLTGSFAPANQILGIFFNG